MKKIIIAAALVFTTGIIASTNSNTVKVVKITTTTADKNVVATAD